MTVYDYANYQPSYVDFKNTNPAKVGGESDTAPSYQQGFVYGVDVKCYLGANDQLLMAFKNSAGTIRLEVSEKIHLHLIIMAENDFLRN